ncbi:MAG: hypothetical protein ACYC1D_13250 [Acidimicrobiales bacterium]
MSPEVLSKEVEQLRAWVEDQRVGDLIVLSATATYGEDASGDSAIFIDLVLPSPTAETRTWPVDDVLDLHDAIDEKAQALGVHFPWHVRLFPDHEVEPDTEEPSG